MNELLNPVHLHPAVKYTKYIYVFTRYFATLWKKSVYTDNTVGESSERSFMSKLRRDASGNVHAVESLLYTPVDNKTVSKAQEDKIDSLMASLLPH